MPRTRVSMQLVQTGTADAFRRREDTLPEPQAGEIRIAVQTAGVAFADVLMRHGKYPGAPKPPFTPGYDVMGVVDAVGSGVSAFSVGDSVVALTQFGGYSTSVCLPHTRAVKVPADIDPTHAVALVLNYVSAYQMLHSIAHVQDGDRILVHSAAGGVGTALLQIAREAGAVAYGTASSGKQDVVRALGATPIDYQNADFVERLAELEPQGLDVAFDPIGPESWLRSRAVLRRRGLLVAFGATGNFANDEVTGSFFALLLRVARMKLFGAGRRFVFFGIEFKKAETFRRDLGRVVDLYTSGAIEPIIGAVFPLEEVGRAHQDLVHGRTRGKIVLRCA